LKLTLNVFVQGHISITKMGGKVAAAGGFSLIARAGGRDPKGSAGLQAYNAFIR